MLVIQLIVTMFDVLPVLRHLHLRMRLLQMIRGLLIVAVNVVPNHVQYKLEQKIDIRSIENNKD